jgi:hypothetical protein
VASRESTGSFMKSASTHESIKRNAPLQIIRIDRSRADRWLIARAVRSPGSDAAYCRKRGTAGKLKRVLLRILVREAMWTLQKSRSVWFVVVALQKQVARGLVAAIS